MKSILLLSILTISVPLSAYGQDDIRSVDFKNFDYYPYCVSDKPEKTTVKNGEYSYDKQEDDYVDHYWFGITSIKYGDVTGDGKDDALILSVCSTGGTGKFSEGYIYSMKGGKPMLVARIPGGDRAYGGLRDARADGGLVVVDSNDIGETGGACCPEQVVTTRYRIQNGKLVEEGKPARRELFPSQPVTFARGTSGTTMKVKVPPQEGKRFVLGARAGQLLSVSSNSDKVGLRLLDDVETKQDVGGFSATLPRNGNYTIEVSNYEDSEVEIILNIKIR